MGNDSRHPKLARGLQGPDHLWGSAGGLHNQVKPIAPFENGRCHLRAKIGPVKKQLKHVFGTCGDLIEQLGDQGQGGIETAPDIGVIISGHQLIALAVFAGVGDVAGKCGQLPDELAQQAVDIPGVAVLGCRHVGQQGCIAIQRPQGQQVHHVTGAEFSRMQSPDHACTPQAAGCGNQSDRGSP
jgi:hypothetical protein